LLLAACLTPSACGKRAESPEPAFHCPTKLSRALAFSHLKEAHVRLETMTTEAAENAITLTTDGLSCAPPHGKAHSSVVARLLLERARASASLGRNESALQDLEAAVLWAERGKHESGGNEDPLLIPEIHLTSAFLFLRVPDHKSAAKSASKARDAASKVGIEAAAIECEALLLEGELAHQRNDQSYPPEGYFRRVLDVARRHGYPEEIHDYVERAAFRLEDIDDDERQRLLGDADAAKKRRADEQTHRTKKGPSQVGPPDLVSLSSGSISGADQTIAALRSRFRDCYRRTASDSRGVRAVLTITVGPSGFVEAVDARSDDMNRATVDCLVAEAKGARFNPPESEQAVLVVPVTLVQQ
jgi:hypothetical protein